MAGSHIQEPAVSFYRVWRCNVISLNRDLLTVYDINTLLGLGLANAIQVVKRGIIVYVILNNIDSGRDTLCYIYKVFPTFRCLVFFYSAHRYIKRGINKCII